MNEETLKGHQHGRHAGREDLTGEHRWGDTLQLVFLALFLALWILDSFVYHFSDFLSRIIPWYIRLMAAALVLVPAFLLASGGSRIVFGERREIPAVISKGVFSIVRHPIYLGAILLYLGFVLTTLSLLSAALWLIIVGFYRYISGYEERLLTRRFGDSYLEYKRRVPMLFPLRF